MTVPPRVLMVSKACVVGIYQRKLEDLASLGVDLTVAVPPSWKDERGEQPLERVYTSGYRLEVLPIRLNGNFHLHWYGGLGRLIRNVRPQIVHIDEEPYNVAAWQAYYHAKRVGARTVVFTWQNIVRHYPPPFSWGEQRILSGIDGLIAGADSAAEIWRQKGYGGPLWTIPQFGTDPDLFTPAGQRPERPFTIGYFGRLIEEKGVRVLLDAVTLLDDDWRLMLLGGGPLRRELEAQAKSLNVADRVTLLDQVPSVEMPRMYRRIDVLVLPSLTRPNWKEQFGRVLVEAMCSGVPVIGSDSGAIPSVIGDAGLIVAEGEAAALRDAIARLRDDSALYAQLVAAGRQRAVERFTQRAVAEATLYVYTEVLSRASP